MLRYSKSSKKSRQILGFAMTECMQVTTTVASREEADNLTRLVLDKRLAACVQVSNCTSSYHWQGAVEQADEIKLTMKTASRLYDTPEILTVPIIFCQ
jgi:periplasmic divalent cation tolerance protein